MAKINVKSLDLDLKQLNEEELLSLITQIEIAGFNVEIVNGKLLITAPLSNEYFSSIENDEITIKELKILLEGQDVKAGDLIDELVAKFEENNQGETLLGQNIMNDKNVDNIATAAGPGAQGGQRHVVEELVDEPKERTFNNFTYERVFDQENFVTNNTLAIDNPTTSNNAPILEITNTNTPDISEVVKSFKVSVGQNLSAELIALYTPLNINALKDLALNIKTKVPSGSSTEAEKLSISFEMITILEDFNTQYPNLIGQIINAISGEGRADFALSALNFQEFIKYNAESIVGNTDLSAADLYTIFQLMSPANMLAIKSISADFGDLLSDNPTLIKDLNNIRTTIGTDTLNTLATDFIENKSIMDTLLKPTIQAALNDTNVISVASNSKIISVVTSSNPNQNIATLSTNEVTLMNNLLNDADSMIILNKLLANNGELLNEINSIPTNITNFSITNPSSVADIIKLLGNDTLVSASKELYRDSDLFVSNNKDLLVNLSTLSKNVDFTKLYQDAISLFDMNKDGTKYSMSIDLSPQMIAYYLQTGKILKVGNEYTTNNPALEADAKIINNYSLDITSAVTLNDSDNSNLQSAKIQIKDGFNSENDLLSIDTTHLPSGVTTTWNTTTGTLTIDGEASIAQYNDILSNVVYTNSSSTSQYDVKTFDFSINDGRLDSEISEIKINESDDINYSATNIDGGTGYDSLIFSSDDTNIDIHSLLNTASIKNIEEISLTDSDHILANISLDDVIAMSDENNTLKITSDNTSDKMDIDTVGTNNEWTKDLKDDGSDGYITYTGVSASNEAVTLLVDKDITVTDI